MILRPKQFYFASFAMFIVALSFPLQVMVLYGHTMAEWPAILSKITWLNWLVIGSLLAGAYFYFHGSRWILWSAPVILCLLAINNYIVGQFAGDYSPNQTHLATLSSLFLFAPLLMPSSQVILRDPKRRWWRRSQRINKRVSTTLNPYVGDMIQAHTFDVSKSGAFLCLDEKSGPLPKVGDTVRISFNVTSMRKIRCEAVVVRVSEPQGRYPRGLGVRFVQIEKNHEKNFRQFLQSNDFSH